MALIGFAAGFVLTTGGYALWRYRRQIEKLLTDFIEWVNVKIKHVASYARDMLRGLAVATRNIVRTAIESLKRQWNSISPESRHSLTEATNEIILAGIRGGVSVVRDKIRQRFPDNTSPERQVLNAVESEIQRLQGDINGSMTRYLL